MNRFLRSSSVFLACLFGQLTCIADEHYKNEPYGIDVKVDGEWRIVSSAKLQIDLHSLSDDQLKELIKGRYEILNMRNGDDETSPSISIVLMPLSRSEFKTAVEYAQSWERGAKSRNETVVQGAEACTIADVPSAFVVIKRSANRRSFITYQYFIRRARSAVLITGTVNDGADQRTIEDLNQQIKKMVISADSDSPAE